MGDGPYGSLWWLRTLKSRWGWVSQETERVGVGRGIHDWHYYNKLPVVRFTVERDWVSGTRKDAGKGGYSQAYKKLGVGKQTIKREVYEPQTEIRKVSQSRRLSLVMALTRTEKG